MPPLAGFSLPATIGLLALTTLVFVGQLVVALGHDPSAGVLLTGGSNADVLRFGALPLGSLELLAAEPWRLLSAAFVHVGIIHFLMNASGLYYLGRLTEPAIGPWRFVLVYVATALAGYLASALYYQLAGAHALTAGSSGALFGLLGVVLGILVRRRDPRWKLWLTQAVLFALAFGFAVGVANNSAHVGGLLLGAGFGLALGPEQPGPSPRWQRWLAIASLGACVVALVLVQRSPWWRLLDQALPR